MDNQANGNIQLKTSPGMDNEANRNIQLKTSPDMDNQANTNIQLKTFPGPEPCQCPFQTLWCTLYIGL